MQNSYEPMNGRGAAQCAERAEHRKTAEKSVVKIKALLAFCVDVDKPEFSK